MPALELQPTKAGKRGLFLEAKQLRQLVALRVRGAIPSVLRKGLKVGALVTQLGNSTTNPDGPKTSWNCIGQNRKLR
jgi:hypothetical protein